MAGSIRLDDLPLKLFASPTSKTSSLSTTTSKSWPKPKAKAKDAKAATKRPSRPTRMASASPVATSSEPTEGGSDVCKDLAPQEGAWMDCRSPGNHKHRGDCGLASPPRPPPASLAVAR